MVCTRHRLLLMLIPLARPLRGGTALQFPTCRQACPVLLPRAWVPVASSSSSSDGGGDGTGDGPAAGAGEEENGIVPLTPEEARQFFPDSTPEPGPRQTTLDQPLRSPVRATSTNALSDRLVIQVKALRGDFDPSDAATDTEHDAQLAAALLQWPASITFVVVGVNEPGFRDDIVGMVSAAADGGMLQVQEQERANGKFLSVKMTAMIDEPSTVDDLHARFKADPRVKMSF